MFGANDPWLTRARVARAGRNGMTSTPRKGSLGNRLAMWRALRAAPATGFVSQPEPRSIGLYARGKQLVAGNFQFAGEVVEAPIQPLDAQGHQREKQGRSAVADRAGMGHRLGADCRRA